MIVCMCDICKEIIDPLNANIVSFFKRHEDTSRLNQAELRLHLCDSCYEYLKMYVISSQY